MAADSSNSASGSGRQSAQGRGVSTISTMNGVGRPNGEPQARRNVTGTVRAGRRQGLSARS